MKSVKRISSLLLALLMILTMSVTTFAAGAAGATETKGSITIDNPMTGQDYTAYKIFDVVYNEGKTAYSYTIDSGSAWFSTVQSYAGLKLTQVNGGTTYIVETKDKFSAPEFSNVLKDAVAEKTGKPLTVADGKASATGLDLGYYFVTSNNGALCNLTTTNPSVTIHDKNEVLFKKEANKTSADVGDTVTYTIKGKVPEYAGFATYTYLITDEMSAGLTFNKDVKVTVGGVDLASDKFTLEYNVEDKANKFTVSIPVQKYKVGGLITVTYTATLNENAIAQISNNKATLTYSNDPTKGTEYTTTPSQEQKVYSSKIVIDKYDTNDTSKKLSGAEFVLYKKAEDSSKQYFSCNDTTKEVTWVTDKDHATKKTTGPNGAASFEGLADGTYYLEETKAPAGYNPLSGPRTIEVKGNNTEASLTITEKVENSRGTILPSTGGMGTTFFYVIGGIFVLASVVLLITRKRMEKVEK